MYSNITEGSGVVVPLYAATASSIFRWAAARTTSLDLSSSSPLERRYFSNLVIGLFLSHSATSSGALSLFETSSAVVCGPSL